MENVIKRNKNLRRIKSIPAKISVSIQIERSPGSIHESGTSSQRTIFTGRQDGTQKMAPNTVYNTAFGINALETQFSRPLLRVSQIETQDQLIKRILGNLREIQDGVQSAGRTLLRTGRRKCEQYPEAAVIETLNLLKECSSQISDDLFPLLKRLSQRKNCKSC